MANLDDQKVPPKHMTLKSVDAAKKLLERNTFKDDIEVTFRSVPDFVGNTGKPFFEIILTLTTSTNEVRALGTLATTTGQDEADKKSLIAYWESELGLPPGPQHDFNSLLAHNQACKERKEVDNERRAE